MARTSLDSRPDRQRFVALRLATLARTPGAHTGDAARAQLAALWARAEHLGLAHHHSPSAQILWFRDPATWFGGAATIAFVDRDARAAGPAAARELAALVDVARAAAFEPLTWLEIDAHDRPLREALLGVGFGIDSIVQVGDPRVALARLVARHDPPETLAAHGLVLAPAEPDDVPSVVALHQRIFSARPELCFFGAFPAHLARMHQDLAAQLAARAPSAPPAHWVVREAGRVVGHVDAEVTPDHPIWGTYTGLGLVLAEHLQGRGIVKTLYRVALSAALARGATLMKGGTSQPAVLGLGRLMARPWHALGLRPNAPLPAEHFLRFAAPPPAQGQSDR